jgi:2-iminobutanoate/2-iminopropanoate deaminase
MIETINSNTAPAAIGPYAQATVAGGLVFVSGQLPADPKTGKLATDPAAACDAALSNIAAILEEKKLTLRDVVKVNIFLSDMGDFSSVNEAYEKRFRSPYPARVCVAVAALPRGAVLEIEAIALLRQ